MTDILSLAQQFRDKSSKTVETIETALQNDLGNLHSFFMQSLSESENIIKQGTESLDDKKTKLEQSLETHHQAITTIFSTHITNLQTLTTESLEAQEIEIKTMMGEYSQELSETMQAHQENALNFIYHRAWLVVIGCAIVALVMMGFGVMVGMKLG